MKTILVLSVFTLTRLGLCHEGHGIPGALPPAPHGGMVQEAGHAAGEEHEHEHEGEGEHGHEGKEEKETELFFEVNYKDKELSIYPLALNPEKPNAFQVLSAKAVLSKINLKAEFPRAKKFEALTPVMGDDAIKASFDSKNANRFIVHIGAEFEKEMKLAKVQIERK